MTHYNAVEVELLYQDMLLRIKAKASRRECIGESVPGNSPLVKLHSFCFACRCAIASTSLQIPGSGGRKINGSGEAKDQDAPSFKKRLPMIAAVV